MRVGMHSGGPVTAGVLRGDRGRYQEVFGDTVNTAARIESSGLHTNKLHISESTTELLPDAGYKSWLTPRAAPVEAKGKCTLQTYWVSKHVFRNEVFKIKFQLLESGMSGNTSGWTMNK
jgi:class 3 adenylate cyclase